MIVLQGDNRRLLSASKYTFLATNYGSGVTSLSVLNATDTDFSTGVPILLGDIGSENAEIVYISTVDSVAGIITLTTPILFPHSESSRVSVLPYDKIRYFWTPDTNFAVSNPLTGYIPIQVSDWFTSYSDQSQSTG